MSAKLRAMVVQFLGGVGFGGDLSRAAKVPVPGFLGSGQCLALARHEIDLWEVDLDASRLAEHVGEDVQGHDSDDLDEFAVRQAGRTRGVELRSRDFAEVFVQRLREAHGTRGLLVGRRALAVQRHLLVAEACVPTDRGVRGHAILTAVALGDRQRDALLRGLVDGEPGRSAVQPEEAGKGLGRVGEDADEVGGDPELGLDGIEQFGGFAGGSLRIDDGDAGHGGFLRGWGWGGFASSAVAADESNALRDGPGDPWGTRQLIAAFIAAIDNARMDKLKAMSAFVRIVEAGSITAAALESELGVRLINRTTRRMALTDEGREYVERCRLVLSAVDETEASLRARRAEPRGRRRVPSSGTFGRSPLG